jgi:hypothetical protein
MCAWVATASAQEVVREFSWSELKKAGQLAAGEVLPGGTAGAAEQLKIENPDGGPRTVTVLDLPKPGVTTVTYALEGNVRYENVEGKGYLEMWNWFANGGMYFSRTLGDSGPMQCVEGTSDWRPFSLPFFSDEKAGSPTRIVFNVVFADKGTVFLSAVKLVQYQGSDLAKQLQVGMGHGSGWWSAETCGWIGGIGGGVCGLVGALIGTLASLGKARRFVLVLTAGMTVVGVICLVVGIVAVSLRQPYEVYYPLLLGGVIMAAVCGGNLRPFADATNSSNFARWRPSMQSSRPRLAWGNGVVQGNSHSRGRLDHNSRPCIEAGRALESIIRVLSGLARARDSANLLICKRLRFRAARLRRPEGSMRLR